MKRSRNGASGMRLGMVTKLATAGASIVVLVIGAGAPAQAISATTSDQRSPWRTAMENIPSSEYAADNAAIANYEKEHPLDIGGLSDLVRSMTGLEIPVTLNGVDGTLTGDQAQAVMGRPARGSSSISIHKGSESTLRSGRRVHSRVLMGSVDRGPKQRSWVLRTRHLELRRCVRKRFGARRYGRNSAQHELRLPLDSQHLFASELLRRHVRRRRCYVLERVGGQFVCAGGWASGPGHKLHAECGSWHRRYAG